MKIPLVALITLALLASILAGCVDSPEGEAGETPTQDDEGKDLWLADFTKCRGDYPPEREVPIRCEQELEELEPIQGAPQGGWECVEEAKGDRSQNAWARLYHNTTDDQYAIHYNTSVNIPVSGILALEANGTTEYRSWNGGNRNATVTLGPQEPGTDLTLLVFLTTHQSEHEALQHGNFSVFWSLYNGAPYPVRVLDTGNETYYFHHAMHRPKEVFPYTWGISMDLEADDFMISIIYFDLLQVGLHIPDGPDSADGC